MQLLLLALTLSAGPGLASGDAVTCSVRDAQALLQTKYQTQLTRSETAENSEPPDGGGGGLTDCRQSYPLPVLLAGTTLQSMGYAPVVQDCSKRDTEVLMLAQLDSVSKTYSAFRIPPITILFVFAFVSFSFVATILVSVWQITTDKDKLQQSKYPEADAWQRNPVDWLWMGWATQWIARWGTVSDSNLTKISAADIPLSDPNDECDVCFEKFERLWREEIGRVGLANASLLKTVTRFVTYRKVFSIGFWNAFYEGFLFIGPPMAIKWMTNYINWLYTQRGLGVDVSGDQLVGPSLLIIGIFAGLPTMMAISNSMCSMLNGRISIRIDGALSLAVYDKAQRLPVVQDCGEEVTLKEGPGTKKGGDFEKGGDSCRSSPKLGDSSTKSSKSGSEDADLDGTEEEIFDATPPDEEELLIANNYCPKRSNLVQVVTNDINTNLMAIPNCLARMIVMVPVLIGTLCMLINEIGKAFFFSLGMAMMNLVLMVCVGLLMRNSLCLFYSTSGQRLQFLQEVIAGIRFIKGCGAEGIVYDKLNKARETEIRSLDVFYTIQCFMFVLALQFPKLYLLVSLAGYAVFHNGTVEPTVIMSLIPLLMSVQGAIAVVFSLIPALVLAMPSCRRLEAFLKIKEAPRCMPMPLEGEAPLPPYLTITEEGETPVMRVQGSFSWKCQDRPTLSNLDVCVQQGKLVAILGAVGSGKTTFMNTVLGELFPSGEARLEVQRRIAYSAQVPHLFEGSLKENIIKGDPMDLPRYKQAIYCAGLTADLEILPGADEVPVGGRGLALSGGQKARVSLARAAYDKADLVLLDDPYAAVDPHTAKHLNEHLVHGPLMKNRTRLVACQPDSELISRFDWVIILGDGCITAQGPPSSIVGTEEYRKLQSTATQGVVGHDEEEIPDQRSGVVAKPAGQEAHELREEECEGRASWATVSYFVRMGGPVAITTCILAYLVKNVFDMRTQVGLSIWMSHGSMYDAGLLSVKPNTWSYIMGYLFWACLSTVAWFVCWVGGQTWTLQISKTCHAAMMRALLHAPVDRFYDKTPVGRIMNRMANDMMNVDMQVFVGCCSTIGMIWSLSVPIGYVHLTMPIWFSVASMPFYYLIFTLIVLYWKTMVPLRYLMQVSKSGVSSEIADVETTPATVRAYNMEQHRLNTFMLAVRQMICADFLGRIVCIRWLCNRLFILGGCFVTGLALICVWVPGAMDVGSASLVINTMFGLIVAIENNLNTGSMAQYQIIAMNRIYEYTSLPEEREEVLPGDKTFQNITAGIGRAALGDLKSKVVDGVTEIYQCLSNGTEDLVLRQIPGRTAFLPAPGKMLADLAPMAKELRGTDSWHRLVGVNSAHRTVEDLAEEFCNGDSPEVVLHVESGWLADGVKVDIQDLRIGYADVPQDVLKGVSLSIPRKCKVGVVGPTGCGKSTLLLSLLRMLEPRAGRIFLEGVDTQTLGLRTLRQALGLVPQDPVLLQGTLRFNIDPFELYDDGRIWEALRLVQMEETVAGFSDALDFSITGEGSNLSFGQRQLLSLARNIVRKPMLLLLDEATSAIDPRTQELLQNTINQAFPDSTMVVIAHRLETILDFDLAVVMDRGHIVEKGPVKELAKTPSGRFAKMLAAKGLKMPTK